jgi:hypothetical protein
VASDSLSSSTTIFSGQKNPSAGSQTVTLTGNISGTSSTDKVTDTFKLTCITTTGSQVNNTVTVNLFYTVNGSCTPNWQCSSWGVCNGSQHTRTCVDYNGCGSLTGKPAESESCSFSLATIVLSPTSANLYTGNTQQLTATKFDQYGNTISASLTWSSSNTSIATVNSSGLVTAVGAGTAIITASSGSVVSNSSAITVLSSAPTATINASDIRLGGVDYYTTITWSSTDANSCVVTKTENQPEDNINVSTLWTCNSLDNCRLGSNSKQYLHAWIINTTYTINCTGIGTATDSVAVAYPRF